MELLWWPLADEALTRLERGATPKVVISVRQTLAALEGDPFDPRLGTKQFRTRDYGHVRATPVRGAEWWVLWQLGETDDTIEIILLREISL